MSEMIIFSDFFSYLELDNLAVLDKSIKLLPGQTPLKESDVDPLYRGTSDKDRSR